MRKPPLLIALLVGSLALTGCSRNPVAPQVDLATDPSASSMRGSQAEDPPPPDVVGEGGATIAAHVQANDAGTLQVGRWSLKIHKNSIQQDANISLTVTGADAMEVMIEVTPASANNFKVPIELVRDCSDMTGMVFEDNTVFWWNDGWVEADDVAIQGASTLKAKTKTLWNAKIAPRVTLETARARE